MQTTVKFQCNNSAVFSLIISLAQSWRAARLMTARGHSFVERVLFSLSSLVAAHMILMAFPFSTVVRWSRSHGLCEQDALNWGTAISVLTRDTSICMSMRSSTGQRFAFDFSLPIPQDVKTILPAASSSAPIIFIFWHGSRVTMETVRQRWSSRTRLSPWTGTQEADHLQRGIGLNKSRRAFRMRW